MLSGLAVAGFLLCAIQTLPLQREFLGYKNEEKMVMGVGLDRYWLYFTQQMSKKAFTRGEDHVFDPEAAYIDMYTLRRAIGAAKAGQEESPAPEGAPPAPGGPPPPPADGSAL